MTSIANPLDRHGLLIVLAVCISCKPTTEPAKPAAAGPQMRATVVTIRTTVQPERKTYDHALVIVGDRVRSTGERDTWRLFDAKAKTVTFVDDVAQTFRTEPLSSIVEERNAKNGAGLADHYPRATFERSSDRRTILGVNAEKVTIAAGAFKRELWLAEHPSIPRGLFAMMYASEPPSSPLAPMMRTVDRAIESTRGFPLVDRTTVPLDGNELVVERTVIGVGARDVPESLLAIPKNYRDAGEPTSSATRPTSRDRT